MGGTALVRVAFTTFKSVATTSPSKKDILSDVLFVWRYRPDLNWGMRVLQTLALPLGHGTVYENRNAMRSYFI